MVSYSFFTLVRIHGKLNQETKVIINQRKKGLLMGHKHRKINFDKKLYKSNNKTTKYKTVIVCKQLVISYEDMSSLINIT
ncbi:hypothetical protein GDO86_009458 [Hymenochirus boettgeri]|uniref:Uncharacterized protein n=1 Tax=Hymenochirus boettgeri TaxID=247094 RepID=A0A8T2JP84_9PIPI|nr:hypothetical protein GDO86_009458 [Hymenochirus boettgeri]